MEDTVQKLAIFPQTKTLACGFHASAHHSGWLQNVIITTAE